MAGLKKTLFYSFLAVLMGITVYLAFEKFFTSSIPEYAKNIAAAFFGAVITMVITAVLLNAQSASELGKEKSFGIFSAKLEMYKNFLDFINDIIDDEVIDKEEIKQFKKWALKLSLISGSDATATITTFISQTIEVGKFRWINLTKSERQKWKKWFEKEYEEKWEEKIDNDENDDFISIGSLIHSLKIDLGEQDVSDFNKATENWILIDELIQRKAKS